MALYTKDSLERLKDAIDMMGLVGARTDLRRVGSRWVGLCPFHEERTPSFSVDVEKKLYHCFGCGASGDAIGFVMETEALDFPGAVEQLADRYGIELQREDEDPDAERKRRERERQLALLERTASFYAAFLWNADEAAPAREYLAGRGLGEDVLREYGVGYAPSAWDRVTAAAGRDGFSDDDLLATGLAQRGRGLYDRFRERITFPLADGRGRVRGFGARAVKADQKPKYLNTAEGPLFHKGRQLFGLDKARPPAAKRGRLVVVEGYTDVLALHQAGVGEAVAIMGTALTGDQMAELARAAPLVLLALDADASGQEAMLRAAREARTRQVALKAVGMPPGRDPADLLADEGAEPFIARLEAAMDVREFEVRRVLADEDLGSLDGKERALSRAASVIAETDSVMRHGLVRYVSDRLDVPVHLVTAQLTNRPAPTGKVVEEDRRQAAPSPPVERKERALLSMCLASGQLGREYLGRLGDDHLSTDVARRARDHLVEHFTDPMVGLPEDDAALGGLVTDVADEAQTRPSPTEHQLRATFLPFERERIARELRDATSERDFARQGELARRQQEIREEMGTEIGHTT